MALISQNMLEKEKHNLHRILIILPFLAVGFVTLFSVVYTAWASGITPSAVIDLTNRARTEKGLPELRENPKLSQAAKMKAEDMIKNDYFAHTSPSGLNPWHWLKQAGYAYKAAGENLAINFTDPKEQQSAWMKSETHRANILNSKYQEIGVAVVEGKIDGERSLVTVQVFGTPTAAVADQAKPAVLPAAKEAKIPEIKGVEVQTPSENLLEAAVPAVKMPIISQTSQKSLGMADKLFNITWLAAVILLLGTLLFGPMMFLYRSYRLIRLGLKAKKMNEESEKGFIEPSHA